MNEGDASWKEQLLEDAMALEMFDLGTWAQFKKDLNDALKSYDTPGDAWEEMKWETTQSRSILPNSRC